MADREETEEALMEAIWHCATAAKDFNGQTAESYASAARQFAEARAWLTAPSQPHGAHGTTTVNT